MKKYTTLFFTLLFLGIGKLEPIASTTTKATPKVINEILFVNILRDIELLNAWIANKNLPKETADIVYAQHYQAILSLYQVDQKKFEESIAFYLKHSLERATKVYEQTSIAIEALL
ncbi:DUF4296 domain-containing protein [Cardinium endosymbiont of Culicoides punctatus]|uniref:DUF4296 domain-containing protein n=1 Tax=Cardinium endosymbiont of Culicoides punctatus TaxID=2304601 RepID=UPI0010586DC7|nr:DUF4296 domain-containing protein [Cardinium endosymbiont of Culicoides punctatus]TDG95467.1 hypothetical protein CCPUN_03670 [Cardinium endosymbiont of Culicoides punctatus]